MYKNKQLRMGWNNMGAKNGDYITLRDRLDRIYQLGAGLAEGKYEGMRSAAKGVLNQQYNLLSPEQRKFLDGLNLPKQDKHLESVLDTFQYLNEKGQIEQNNAYQQPEGAMKSYNRKKGGSIFVVEDEVKDGFSNPKMLDEPIYLTGGNNKSNN